MKPRAVGPGVCLLIAILSVAAVHGVIDRGGDWRLRSSSTLTDLSAAGFAPGWTQGGHSPHPPGVAGGMMAYDRRADVFVLFGGSDGMPLNQTWVLDPKTRSWAQLYPSLSPPARADAMLVYDSIANALVLFGGWSETSDGSYHRFSDTWAFFTSNHTWVPRHPRTSPSPRSDAAVAFDEKDGITLLFGGFDGVHYLGDAWYYVFANDTWISRSSPHSPSPRADGRMVYDPDQRSFFLFSGNDYSDAQFKFHHPADMWRYSWTENAWSQLFPDIMPMPRDYAVFATNLAFDEVLLVGGYGNRTILGDVWAFNTTRLAWRNVTTPDGPSPRMAAVGGYSPQENVLVLYGGGNRTETMTDTWFFRYPPPLIGRIFASSTDPLTGQEVAFTSESLGGSGSFVSASWDFGDGHAGYGQSATHSFGAPGMYRVTFVVTDSLGTQVSRTLELTVGYLVPFWIDVALLSSLVSLATVIIYWLVRRRYRRGA